MIPHKTKRGAAALERLKAFEGVPAPYDKMKRMVIPDALKWVINLSLKMMQFMLFLDNMKNADITRVLAALAMLTCPHYDDYYYFYYYFRVVVTISQHVLILNTTAPLQGVEAAAWPQILFVGTLVRGGRMASLRHHQGTHNCYNPFLEWVHYSY